MFSRLRKLLTTTGLALPHIVRRGFTLGHCPICKKKAIFFKKGDWLRDQLLCVGCNSIPRWRALIYVLDQFVPNWHSLAIHESSPGGAASSKLAAQARLYTPTYFFPEVPLGEYKNGYRCENLEQQTFPDDSFDAIVTQDVFEHVLDPAAAFREVARTLKPGGVHVFTIPWYYWKPTVIRAKKENDTVRHLMSPDYHGNPIDPNGSLVVTEWGHDFCDFVYEHSRLTTTPVRVIDRSQGLQGKFIEVFISRKASIR